VRRPETLAAWLAYLETLHPKAIALGLDRVRAVHAKLDAPVACPVVTVTGTNGKGSTCALLEAILRRAGYRVGLYASPHLLRYNERVRIDGMDADDSALCQAFTRIDAARGDNSLTYFEFGTLAALELFHEARVEVAVLEVGLGGRLDAVNTVDADAALVVSIGIDHVDWLGADRDSIGYEKAGIYRPGRPAICADPDPPRRLIDHAKGIGALLQRIGRDYGFIRTGPTWRWWSAEIRLDGLPPPALAGDHQIGNAAAALATLASLRDRLPVPPTAIHAGLLEASLPGRFQIFPGPVEWILDVAHNPQGAAVLAGNLRARPCSGRTLAILGLLADKDASGVIQALAGTIDEGYAVTLAGSRGRPGADLAAVLRAVGIRATTADHILEGCRAARAAAAPGDRIVVLGSFLTVAPVLAARPWFSDISLSHSREV